MTKENNIYGVFIEPDGELYDFVSRMKKSVELWMPGMKYCLHPPHCTLIAGEYQFNKQIWASEFEESLHNLNSFNVRTRRWRVFENDPLAGGANTIALELDDNIKLRQLQRLSADICARHYFAAAAPQNILPISQAMLDSLIKYGWPFVGDHWLPHITIAAINADINSTLIRDMITKTVDFTFIIRKVEIWNMIGDQHNFVFSTQLGQTDD